MPVDSAPQHAQIWVDADACPRWVRQTVWRAAGRFQHQAIYVSNARLELPDSPWVSHILVAPQPDAADDYIVAHARRGDICITADVPLAARLLDLNLWVLDPRGIRFSTSTITERLEVRERLIALRDHQLYPGGPEPYTAEHLRLFGAWLEWILVQSRLSFLKS